MPAIKREESSEPPIFTIAPAVSPDESSSTHQGCSVSNDQDARASLPPPPGVTKPYIVARQAHLGLGKYYGSSPRKYKLAASGTRYSRVDVPPPPVFSRLPSRLGPSIATGRVNTTTTTLSTRTPTLPKTKHLTQDIKRKSDAKKAIRSKMDDHAFEYGGDNMDGASFTGYPPMMLQGKFRIDQDEDGILVPRTELEELQFSVQLLQHAHATSEQKVQDQGKLIVELITFNQRTHKSIEDLNARVQMIEFATIPGMHPQRRVQPALASPFEPTFSHRDSARSRSPSPHREVYRMREESNRSKKNKEKRKLEISIPGKMYTAPTASLPTPMTLSSSFVRTPNTPLTPGRAGPPNGTKKPLTCINKRGIHNLDKMVPPTNAQLPLLPLTDTEIIVYFFNALCRPIVSLRLYARRWGPAAISEAINSHRVIEPEYLRNTCSVKCTTAIKKGIDRFGPEWEANARAIFESPTTNDAKATDMIRLQEDELEHAVDFELRALCNGLRKHPGEGDAGVFTQCVQFCYDTGADYKLSNVCELVDDWNAGRKPSRLVDAMPELETENESSSRAGSEASYDSVIGDKMEPSSQ